MPRQGKGGVPLPRPVLAGLDASHAERVLSLTICSLEIADTACLRHNREGSAAPEGDSRSASKSDACPALSLSVPSFAGAVSMSSRGQITSWGTCTQLSLGAVGASWLSQLSSRLQHMLLLH